MIPEGFTIVDSSLVKGVHFDELTNTLLVKLSYSEQIYTHNGVPVGLFDLMMTADSIGSFYARNIKKQYPAAPIEPAPIE